MKKDLKRKFKQAVKESRPEQEIGKMRQNFLKMIRLHNKVRKLELKQKEKRDGDKTQNRFKENLHKYAKDLLNDQKKQGEPEFSKEVADKFFKTTYRDGNRQFRCDPLKGIPKPDPQKQNFSSKPPTYEELAEIVHHKRNKSAPGINAVPYLAYKKCPQVLAHVLPIFK